MKTCYAKAIPVSTHNIIMFSCKYTKYIYIYIHVTPPYLQICIITFRTNTIANDTWPFFYSLNLLLLVPRFARAQPTDLVRDIATG